MSRISSWFPIIIVITGLCFVGLELLYYGTVALNFNPPIDLRLSQPVFWSNLYTTTALVVIAFIQTSYMGIILLTGVIGVLLLVFITRQPELVSEETVHPAKILIHNTFAYLGKIARIQGLGDAQGLRFEAAPGALPEVDPEYRRWILQRIDWRGEEPDPETWFEDEPIE